MQLLEHFKTKFREIFPILLLTTTTISLVVEKLYCIHVVYTPRLQVALQVGCRTAERRRQNHRKVSMGRTTNKCSSTFAPRSRRSRRQQEFGKQCVDLTNFVSLNHLRSHRLVIHSNYLFGFVNAIFTASSGITIEQIGQLTGLCRFSAEVRLLALANATQMPCL